MERSAAWWHTRLLIVINAMKCKVNIVLTLLGILQPQTSAATSSAPPFIIATMLPLAQARKKKDRASARRAVQQTWKERRALQGSLSKSYSDEQTVDEEDVSSQQQPPELSSLCQTVASICAVVQRALEQLEYHHRSTRRRSRKPKQESFPSVLSILQANALVNQVQSLQADDPTRLILSVLPSGYDWNAAVEHMSKSRSRAFLLLDLASMVRRTVEWRRRYPLVVFRHVVSDNADEQLLQVLLRSGIRLSVATKSDVVKALGLTKGRTAPPLTDASRAPPPDSYWRVLVRDAGCRKVLIDDGHELQRVRAALERVYARHNESPPVLDYRVRLSDTVSEWSQQCASVRAALGPDSRLTGLALSIGPPEHWNKRQEAVRQLVHDLTQLQPDTKLSIDMTGFTNDFALEWVDWWSTMQELPSVDQIIVDCSLPLVAPAGALCTRIIGVRQTSSDEEIKQHYYIDDGCYGSLYQRADAKFAPLPLLPRKLNDESIGSEQEVTVLSSTVWGPTCDGLDRVCRDIPLPALQRDDWLVFPNRGCSASEGLSTAFNGFNPPDTAYCVLGYFPK